MRLLVQRVRRAWVNIGEAEVGRIGAGALLLLGVARGDTEFDAGFLAGKVSRLRIFDDHEGRLNRDVQAVDGSFLAVSQFTLYGECRKGNRPSYVEAADPGEGRRLYDHFVVALRDLGHRVETGTFQANMVVGLENDGPVTLMLESRGRTKA